MNLSALNPAVPKNWLLVLAGLMWSGVGVLLCGFAFIWLTHPLTRITLSIGVAGILIALYLGAKPFTHLARKNVARILSLSDRACVFSFLAWKGYLMIALMMASGIILRHSAIPKPYLAIVYAAMGGALLQGSLVYHAYVFRLVAANRR